MDLELVQLREALLTTNYTNTLPDGLERLNRYIVYLVLDDTVMSDFRVVMPDSLKKEIIKGLHAAHQACTRTWKKSGHAAGNSTSSNPPRQL